MMVTFIFNSHFLTNNKTKKEIQPFFHVNYLSQHAVEQKGLTKQLVNCN